MIAHAIDTVRRALRGPSIWVLGALDLLAGWSAAGLAILALGFLGFDDEPAIRAMLSDAPSMAIRLTMNSSRCWISAFTSCHQRPMASRRPWSDSASAIRYRCLMKGVWLGLPGFSRPSASKSLSLLKAICGR